MLFLAMVFAMLILFYCGFLLNHGMRFGSIRKYDEENGSLSVAVIIPARNEEKRIAGILESLMNQDYTSDRLEIIVINDHSEDRTLEIATGFSRKDGRIRVINLPDGETNSFKKAAIRFGIENSRSDLIMTTDADCVAGPSWISSMAAAFAPGTDLVSGPVLLMTNGKLFQQFQSLEFMGLIALGGGSIAAGRPNMCNGANLAYRRSAFGKVGGFSDIDSIASGDDELLLHKIAKFSRGNVRFNKNPDAVIRTPAQETWRDLKNQRKRWVSKSREYDNKGITYILMAVYAGMLGFPALAIAGFFDSVWWVWLLGILAAKAIAELLVLIPAAAFFRKLSLLIYLPAGQPIHIAYLLWAGIAGNSGNYIWKGRRVK